MNRNPKTLIFCWGGILSIVTIIIHLLNMYIIPYEQIILKNVSNIIGLIFSFFCIYKAVFAYRAMQEDKNVFAAIKGITLSLYLLLFLFIVFTLYSIVLYGFIDKDFVENYKIKRTELVQNSDLPVEKKEEILKTIQSITKPYFIVTDALQRMIFPIIGMLFIVAFMQRKPAKTVETKEDNTQQT